MYLNIKYLNINILFILDSQLAINAYEAPKIFKLFKKTYQQIFQNIRKFRENKEKDENLKNTKEFILLDNIINISPNIEINRKQKFILFQKIIENDVNVLLK